MVPGVVQESIFGLPEEKIEQLVLFVLGLFSFSMFLARKYQLRRQKEEKEKEKRKLQQTAKDLVESYSYIGEINRKMDMLMQIGIGLSNHTNINKHRENEIYKSILEASNFLMKGETSLLVFFDVQEKKIKKRALSRQQMQFFQSEFRDLPDGEEHMYQTGKGLYHRSIGKDLRQYKKLYNFQGL